MSKRKFVLNYLKHSPWYLWVLRISGAILIAYIIIKAFKI